jgi:peptidyl-tRNA hydrolase
VRIDLQLGDLAAQLVHAAGETSPGNLPDDTRAVVLAVEGEDELVALSARLERAGVRHKLIREPDAPFNGAATALGIVPCPRRPLRRFLSRYPLLKEK